MIALPLDESDHLTDRVPGRNRDQHVHVVGQQVSFLDAALLLLGQPLEHFAQMAPQLNIQRFAAKLGYKHYVVLALPLRLA